MAFSQENDERSQRTQASSDLHIKSAFLQLRGLPQSPTAPAPSRREPLTQNVPRSIFFVFCSSAIAYFEPRDYRVVFVIQQKNAWKME